jgi:hypothetical protein
MNKPLTEAEVQQMLNPPSEWEVNPWAFAIALAGWIWAAIWFVAWVLA